MYGCEIWRVIVYVVSSTKSWRSSWLMIRKPSVTVKAPSKYSKSTLKPFTSQSPIMARGIVIESPTVTVSGDVKSTARHQQKSLTKVMKALTKRRTTTCLEGGSSNEWPECNKTKKSNEPKKEVSIESSFLTRQPRHGFEFQQNGVDSIDEGTQQR